jgi:surface protein
MLKPKRGAGSHRNPSLGLIMNQPQYIYNKYKPGGTGVGAVSMASRRALNRNSIVCNDNLCGAFYTTLGLKKYPIPIPPILEGTFIYSFVLTSIPDPSYYTTTFLPFFTNKNINVPIPINTNNGGITYTYNVKITGNYFLITVSYKVSSTTTMDGLSFYAADNNIINFYNNYTSDLTIIQFGLVPLSKEGRQFAKLNSLTFSPTSNTPTLYPGTSLNNCFELSKTFNSPINTWNTSNVTSMSSMFQSAGAFNQPINTWNTSNVTSMSSMFQSASVFNQPLNTWNTSNVTSMASMFQSASVFNQNISNWDVTKVNTMSSMFNGATVFNNGGGTTPLTNWSAPLCTSFASMFQSASRFNQELSNLVNTSGVATCSMLSMFQSAVLFNRPLNTWNTSNVTSMASMFQSASVFNSPLNTWNTSNVTSMSSMFQSAGAFNQNISNWNVNKVANMSSMFNGATDFNNGGGDTPLTWSAPLCTSFANMFLSASSFNQPLPNLVDTRGVATCSMASMFQSASVFNKDISGWYVNRVNNMASMFQSASDFNQNIGDWVVSNVASMLNMFREAIDFNNGGSSSISNWAAPLCTSFSGTFRSASSFNQPLTNLVDTSGVATCSMLSMFQLTNDFNQNLNNWDVSKVNTMQSVFLSATAFNNGGGDTPLTWAAPLCTSFANMFQGALSFNQPLPNLVDTSGLTGLPFPNNTCSFSNMFSRAFAFNQNLNNWNMTNASRIDAFVMFYNDPATKPTGVSNFNNGQLGFVTISGTPSSATYINSTTTLLCPGALFLSELTSDDVLIITTSNVIYSSNITSISDNTTLILTLPIPTASNLAVGEILTISKQIAGNAPLTWNLPNVTNMTSAFRNCTYFNQDISRTADKWNVNKVTSVNSMFNGINTSGPPPLSLIQLFNNGQIITGETSPLNWVFTARPTSANWRANCRLTDDNAFTTPALT